MFIEQTSLIIITKDRLNSLKRLFKSIDNYIERFNEILIIDSSSIITHKNIINEYSKYKNINIIKSIPSSSIQRNVGINRFNKSNKYIMFCDDDIIFQANAILNTDKFINEYPNNVGYGLNLLEEKDLNYLDKLKRSSIFMKNGFYHKNPGIVCENGWHTKISNLDKNYKVMWLSTQVCIYNSKFIDNKTLFDVQLGKYSYLEDLFFSYELSKKGILSVCCDATYLHPDNIDRKNINFGIREVLNRYKFVKKNNLNLFKFYITFFLKIFNVLIQILKINFNLFPKFLGNIVGIILCIIKLGK
tara:strand:- start:1590 stop:2495 length:906 start_codon:yes stop_codon:yes gene_type:complete